MLKTLLGIIGKSGKTQIPDYFSDAWCWRHGLQVRVPGKTVWMKIGRVPDCSFITSQLSTSRGSSLSYLTSQPSICLSFVPLSSQVLIIYALEKRINVNNRRLLHLGLSSWPQQCIELQKWKQLEGEVRRLKHIGVRSGKLTLLLLAFWFLSSTCSLFFSRCL